MNGQRKSSNLKNCELSNFHCIMWQHSLECAFLVESDDNDRLPVEFFAFLISKRRTLSNSVWLGIVTFVGPSTNTLKCADDFLAQIAIVNGNSANALMTLQLAMSYSNFPVCCEMLFSVRVQSAYLCTFMFAFWFTINNLVVVHVIPLVWRMYLQSRAIYFLSWEIGLY